MPNAFTAFQGLTGSALADLAGGFGGNQLQSQVAQETDEERRKRLRLLYQQRTPSPFRQNTGPGSALDSLSTQSLFGGYGR